MKQFDTKKIVGLSIFTAIVVVLQLMGSFIHFGMFSISLVLVPIVVGAALYGAAAGAWLGLVFAIIVLISGDAAAFLAVNPLGTILTVVLKGVLSGCAAGLMYRALQEKHKTAAVIASAVICPVVNTGLFIVGMLVFFFDTLSGWAGGQNLLLYIIVGLTGVNFLVELAVNIVLSSGITRIIRAGKKMH